MRHMYDPYPNFGGLDPIPPLVLDPELLGADVAIPIFNQKRHQHTSNTPCTLLQLLLPFLLLFCNRIS